MFSKEPLEIWAWVLIVMGILMLIMITIGVIAYRRAQFEAELKAMNWMIKWEDVSRSMISEKKSNSALAKKVIQNPYDLIDLLHKKLLKIL